MKLPTFLIVTLKLILIVISFVFVILFFIITFIALLQDDPSVLGSLISFLFMSLLIFVIYKLIHSFLNELKNKNKVAKERKESLEQFVNAPRITYTLENMPDLLRTLDDCIVIVNNSKNIETVIARLYLGAKKAYNLQKMEEINLYKNKPTSREFLNIFIDKKGVILNNCIQKAYEDMLEKAAILKTKKGKINRYKKFIDELNKHEDDFLPENYDNVEKIRLELIRRINDKV